MFFHVSFQSVLRPSSQFHDLPIIYMTCSNRGFIYQNIDYIPHFKKAPHFLGYCFGLCINLKRNSKTGKSHSPPLLGPPLLENKTPTSPPFFSPSFLSVEIGAGVELWRGGVFIAIDRPHLHPYLI